jgi:hypothetical protein
LTWSTTTPQWEPVCPVASPSCTTRPPAEQCISGMRGVPFHLLPPGKPRTKSSWNVKPSITKGPLGMTRQWTGMRSNPNCRIRKGVWNPTRSRRSRPKGAPAYPGIIYLVDEKRKMTSPSITFLWASNDPDKLYMDNPVNCRANTCTISSPGSDGGFGHEWGIKIPTLGTNLLTLGS